ncbi:hypothetical protein EYR40_005324 [Pleurotus pulmonarius]|nr:hypothetical protein EYR40_005324 [Pleurotus pulmonarius]
MRCPSCFTLLATLPLLCYALDPVQVTVPALPGSHNIVHPNFLGISLELSFLDEYFGKNASSIPPAVINYLQTIRARTANVPLRLRIGGNSMDSSTYIPDQQSPMLQLTDPNANPNNQPVNYGGTIWEVLNSVAHSTGGAQYLIGLSLLDPNSTNVPLLAGDAKKNLGNNLDAFLLGNEPDLYTAHKQRPNLVNYTTGNYMDEFGKVTNHLKNTTGGNLLELQNLGGPTICCFWDLASLLQDGYLTAYGNDLKYLTLQHYPQNNCVTGKYSYELPWYMIHSNTVKLASWQEHGISLLLNAQGTRPQLLMSEFNSASCGGIPGISDTFAVGAMWSTDYALQLASMGYVAAYLHTRERGITYNIFSPPNTPDLSGNWTTGPSFYSLLVTAEVLSSDNGSFVTDMNLQNSTVDGKATVSAYAIHDAGDSSLRRIVLFNYANSSDPATFAFAAGDFPTTAGVDRVTVKYLSATSAEEKQRISWGGQSFATSGDGTLVTPSGDDAQWAVPNSQIDCTNGCTVNVTGPGVAVVMVASPLASTTPSALGNGGFVRKISPVFVGATMLLGLLLS